MFLIFIKKYWAVIIASFSLTMMFIAKKQFDSEKEQLVHKYTEQLAEQNKSHNADMEKMNKVITESIERQRAIVKNHQDEMQRLQTELEEKICMIEDLRAVKADELAKKIRKEPEQALDELAKKFGFEVVPVIEDVEE